MKDVYRYTFDQCVPIENIEASLLLSVLSAESIHGESQVRLDAQHLLEAETHSCVIDASTAVGRDLNRLFTGYVRREFGEDLFRVKRVNTPAHAEPAGAAA
jgi:hypothetical protein